MIQGTVNAAERGTYIRTVCSMYAHSDVRNRPPAKILWPST